MGKKEKLLVRLQSGPSDFRYDELRALLIGYGCMEDQGAGSRVAFVHGKTKSVLRLHKPHPQNILKQYQLKDVIRFLEQPEVIV